MNERRPGPFAAFLSIPRNASHTIREVLELGPTRDLNEGQPPILDENHQRGRVLAQRHDLSGRFVFCFCREPYQRCVSWFHYHRGLEPYRRMSFEDWVEVGMPHHWQRQNGTDYRRSGLTPLLQSTFVEGVEVDFIGRLERFERDLQTLLVRLAARSRDLGTSPALRFRRLRLNASPPGPPVLTPGTRARIYKLLEEDFVRFGYPETPDES